MSDNRSLDDRSLDDRSLGPKFRDESSIKIHCTRWKETRKIFIKSICVFHFSWRNQILLRFYVSPERKLKKSKLSSSTYLSLLMLWFSLRSRSTRVFVVHGCVPSHFPGPFISLTIHYEVRLLCVVNRVKNSQIIVKFLFGLYSNNLNG